MTVELLIYLEVFGPGIAATVIAGIAVWILRGTLLGIWRAVVWALTGIWSLIIGEIKWRIGW